MYVWFGLSGSLGPSETRSWALAAAGLLVAFTSTSYAQGRGGVTAALKGIALLVGSSFVILKGNPTYLPLAFACAVSITIRYATIDHALVKMLGPALVATSFAEIALFRAETLIHTPLRTSVAGLLDLMGAEALANATASYTYLGLPGLVLGIALCGSAVSRASGMSRKFNATFLLGAIATLGMTWVAMMTHTPIDRLGQPGILDDVHRHIRSTAMTVSTVALLAVMNLVLKGTSNCNANQGIRHAFPFFMAGLIATLLLAYRSGTSYAGEWKPGLKNRRTRFRRTGLEAANIRQLR